MGHMAEGAARAKTARTGRRAAAEAESPVPIGMRGLIGFSSGCFRLFALTAPLPTQSNPYGAHVVARHRGSVARKSARKACARVWRRVFAFGTAYDSMSSFRTALRSRRCGSTYESYTVLLSWASPKSARIRRFAMSSLAARSDCVSCQRSCFAKQFGRCRNSGPANGRSAPGWSPFSSLCPVPIISKPKKKSLWVSSSDTDRRPFYGLCNPSRVRCRAKRRRLPSDNHRKTLSGV